MKRFKILGIAMGALGLATAGCASENISGDFIDARVADDEPDSGGSGGGDPDAGEGGGGDPDAGPMDDAAPDGDGDVPPPPPPPEDHLLLSEVMPSGDAEFIEIFNPGDAPVDLAEYYITDSQNYADIGGDLGEPGSTDFVAQFPSDATIPSGGIITVTVDGENFATAHGQDADFAMRNAGNAAAMVDTAIGTDDFLITNDGEAVVLFTWDGASDLVQDVDMVVAGAAVDGANNIRDKSEVSVGDSTYADDAATMAEAGNQMESDVLTSVSPGSYKRTAPEGDNETQDGTGNGLSGHDETSESIRTTWDSQAASAGYTGPTPGEVPGSLSNPSAL